MPAEQHREGDHRVAMLHLVRSEGLVERRAGYQSAWRSGVLGVADEFSAPIAQNQHSLLALSQCRGGAGA
jgi:hypothetical protein